MEPARQPLPAQRAHLEALPLCARLAHALAAREVHEAQLAAHHGAADEVAALHGDAHDEVAPAAAVVHVGGARGAVGAAALHERHKLRGRGDHLRHDVAHAHAAVRVGDDVVPVLHRVLRWRRCRMPRGLLSHMPRLREWQRVTAATSTICKVQAKPARRDTAADLFISIISFEY